MTITRQQLLIDLYAAYYDARKHKVKRSYVQKYENNLAENLNTLCDELYNRTYIPLPSKCFIIDLPKKREIFAAMFRDRIVHHLYFNYTHELFERTFIKDSYSCIKGRGTHYGINRINDFCRKESLNWQRKCYVMHIDIRGYFMHIERKRLKQLVDESLDKMMSHRISKHSTELWRDKIDIDIVKYLTDIIVNLDPKKNCIMVGNEEDWIGLDEAKSLLKTKDGLGLPIGNLTSQLFSNVYLNPFDQFVKRVLKCKYYGRYVDDAAIVSHDKEMLLSFVPKIQSFLKDKLGLELHMGKLVISEVHKGVEFLGAYIKPYRTYISKDTLQRMKNNIKKIDFSKSFKVLRSVNSYLGILQHSSTFNIRKNLFYTRKYMRYGVFDKDLTKLSDRRKYFKRKKIA